MKRKPLSVPHSLGGTLRTALASLPVFILFIFLPLLSPFPLSLSRIPSLFYLGCYIFISLLDYFCLHSLESSLNARIWFSLIIAILYLYSLEHCLTN